MKVRLASAGTKNPSISTALVGRLGRPIAKSGALYISTASYAWPLADPGRTRNFISGSEPQSPMSELGWKSLKVLMLTVLPSIPSDSWVPLVRKTDVLLVGGGGPLY